MLDVGSTESALKLDSITIQDATKLTPLVGLADTESSVLHCSSL